MGIAWVAIDFVVTADAISSGSGLFFLVELRPTIPAFSNTEAAKNIDHRTPYGRCQRAATLIAPNGLETPTPKENIGEEGVNKEFITPEE